MLLRSYMGGIIAVGSMGLVQDPVTLIALRLLQGVFSGTMSAAQTLVSVNTPEEHNGFALGSLNSAMFSGTLIGAFAGGFVADIYGYRIAFLISGILRTVAFLLVFFGIQEKAETLQKEKPVISGKEKDNFWKSLLLPHPVFIAVWPVLGMMSGVMFTRQFDTSFLPLFVQNIHGSVSGASSWTGALSAVTGTAGALSGFIMGWLADRYRPGRLAVMSALLAAVFMSSLYFCDSFAQLFPLRFFMVFFSSGLDPALQIWLAQSTPLASRGLVFGWACSMRCCGNFSAPLIAGYIVQQSSIRELFLAGPICY